MNLGLNKLHAFVAGSTRGLGFAVARLLAEENAIIAINGRNAESLTKAAHLIMDTTGQDPLALQGDISHPDIPQKIIQQITRSWNRLDLLVCNAGGPPSGLFENLDDKTWQQAIDLSFMSHVRLIRAALPLLRKSPSASVLTITSYSVKQPIPNLILSNSVRAATIGLTKSLALELGQEGIRFNSILPGWTSTERVQELMNFRAESNGTTPDEELSKQAKESPLNRLATPKEFANAAVFILSPAASYITGTMLAVDGGMYKGTL